MTHRIRHVRISPRSLSPVEADLLVEIECDSVQSDVEVRGRLVGPTCPYSTTVEVDYPLRMLPREDENAPLRARVVIPEPSYWDPISPFLYHARIEFWQAGAMLDRAELRHGLRSMQLKPEGLFWNGKRLVLRVADSPTLTTSELPELRRQGIDAILTPLPGPELVFAAEQIGFVVIARIDKPPHETDWARSSPAFFAWMLPAEWQRNEREWRAWMDAVPKPPGLIGAEPSTGSLDGVHFFVGSADELDRPLLGRGSAGNLGQIL